jgi:HK97 family phage prohead protease
MTLQLYRSFTGPIEQTDAHTLTGRIVPWGQEAVVIEPDETGERLVRYSEQWERGAFDTQLKAENQGIVRKIALRDEHAEGLGKIGWALALHDRDDGMWGTFRVREAAMADVSQMYEDGIDGLSVGFHPLRGGTRVQVRAQGDELRVRSRAYIDHVALVATPTWAGARVLALRDSDEMVADMETSRAQDEYLAELDGWLTTTGAQHR